MGRRVLVTGASGFIGGHLARALAAAGDEVHAVSRRPGPGGTPLAWHQADLGDERAVAALVEGARPDLVYHLAGHVTGSRALADLLPAFAANLQSTVNLLAHVSRLGTARLVLAGSLEEPDAGAPTGIPSSPYAAAKLGASAYARMCHALYATPVVVARLFMVYGPGQDDGSKLVPYVIRSLLGGEPPHLSSGTRPVDWVFVDDVVEALAKLGSAAGIEGRTLDVGSGTLHTVREVAEAIGRRIDPGVALGFGVLAERPLEQVRKADAETTALAIGWRARTPLEAGLAETIRWYREGAGAGSTP